MSHLDESIRRAPDPEAAASRIERLRQDASARRALDSLTAPLQERLVRVVSVSDFLNRQLCRHPEFIELTGAPPLRRGASAPTLRDADDLRRLKYAELYRIACADVGGDVDYTEILGALSRLAEEVAREALALAAGPGDAWIWRDALCAIGLGKLGARELNFSSDLDLIFVGGEHSSHARDIGAFQERLLECVHEFSRTLEETGADGFLYRVDLNLRPWGRSGPLCMSVDGTEHYYEASSDVWERYAWLRARPVAGAVALGLELMQRLRPFRFARSLGGRDLERFVGIKQEMGRARERRGHWNVKVGEGGIRDIEFFIQTLQLLHGARDPRLRTTNTLEALCGLVAIGLVPATDEAGIRDAYLLLRRIENRLQMADEQQTHELPDDPGRRAVLARSLFDTGADGGAAIERFEAELEAARNVARSCFERVLPEGGGVAAPEDEDLRRALREAWRPEAAIASLDRWRQVCATEGWGPVPRDRATLVRVFGSSWYLTRFMFYRGADAAQLLDTPPAAGFGHEDLRRWGASLPRGGDPEKQLERVRVARNELMLLVLAAWLNGRLDQEQLEQTLTGLAEEVVRAAIELFGLAPEQEDTGFAVFGMGRLAGGEMTFGSDLDLIFLYRDAERREPLELSRRVRRLLRHIAAATPAGALYDVDMRLRPHGSAGALLTSVQSFEQYHHAGREIWERQMMTRCRPVYERDGLGQAALDAIRPDIYRDYDPSELRREIASMRLRVERELGSPRSGIELKRGRGGIMDVDFAAHCLQLVHGHADPDFRTCSTRRVLRLARDRGLLGGDAARDLLDGYEYLKRMETCLRLFDLKSISFVAPESEAGIALARAMGFREAGVRALMEEYRAVTGRVRQRFEEVVGSTAASGG